MATLKLDVITPEKTVVSKDVDMVICPGEAGEFGVLPHHVSLLSALRIGPLRYHSKDGDETIFISGGFVEVNDNKCSVLAESAERAADIDTARALAAKERAQRRLAEKKEEVDEVRALIALRRAEARLQIAGAAN